ncbi:citrate/2-methylcitrate synthase [Leekyejoonella antrihumi]|uniref:Citrate synthase n=1 Tax=Leekyejoonella antrihumi TaxID=1660198 RepID=A0A563E3E0_9MICO|nr:citrate/2-methylcitrate synthase [Leekyejoonella antrihumi]TWP37040.1 citrate synthase/methylcitrate synthase [Leekyejoonella antrihumi]
MDTDNTTPTAPLIAPAGLAGVSVVDTEIGDVRGGEGFFHYRQFDATELARRRSIEDVWHLLIRGSLPDSEESSRWRVELASAADLSPDLRRRLVEVVRCGHSTIPLGTLRTAVSAFGELIGAAPLWDSNDADKQCAALQTAAVVPWLVTAAHTLSHGGTPRDPRPDLGFVGSYLWMLNGAEPASEHVAALSRYLCLTIDHGLNASTFTARVIASTGADLPACVVGAIGALSGPLHGGAPSRALAALDEIGTADRAQEWACHRLARGERLMGFGHAVYRGLDPRSELLKETAIELDTPLARLAVEVESEVVKVLDEAKPDRPLRANVEYYAGVVMQACGVPAEMFTATFAASRVIGWTAHILEQSRGRKIFRPSSRYTGPAAPVPVPDEV